MKKILYTLSILFICIGCVESHKDDTSYTYLTNKSLDSIYYYVNIVSYPDTSATMFLVREKELFYVPPLKTEMLETYYTWDNDYMDTVMIYIYSDTVYKKYTNQEIYENYMVLARYDLSPEDLKFLDHKVVYPPSEKMSGMKMYIPKK